jgi:excisionase family DNA binding protein
MPGMFYSLREAAERLGVAEEQVKQLVADGRLREFRDGSNLLFKIDEVNALAAEEAELPVGDVELGDSAGEELPAELAEDTGGPSLDDSLEDDIFKPDEEEAAAVEPAAEGDATAGLEPTPEAADEESSGLELPAEAGGEASSELDLAPEAEPPADTTGADELALLEEESAPAAAEDTSDEISLAAESDVLAAESDITSMDTAVAGESASVLSESDLDASVTEDSMAETAGPAGTSAEASLEEIEDDVNLDSFGSGSGLLDLSLQADDTSLGGILDEIYTAEGEGEKPGAEAEAPASFDDITAEADQVASEEETTIPEPGAAVMPVAAVSPIYAEAAPDAQSNILGLLLFLPLLALLYTAIVTVAAWRHVTPSILSSVQGLLWYLIGAGIVVALIVVGASFVVGGERAPKAARPAREKKVKAEKPKKEKPAKEKKSFFGKKKEK